MNGFTRRNIGLGAGMATAVALTAGALISLSANASPDVAPGMAAPGFEAVTSLGETVSLADFSGKTVVLEWTNDGCPFVQKHYGEPVRNMQTLQGSAAADDVVWLSVISSAPGKQGHVDGPGADAINAARGGQPSYTLLDPQGVIGRAYSAKTTPHMFVIDPEGEIAYAGAIDSIVSAKTSDIERAEPYFANALDQVRAGAEVTLASSKPYGCSVKY